MRRSFRMGYPASAVLVSPEAALGKAQVSHWIFRLLELSIPLDSNFFSCLQWCTDDLKGLTTMLQEQIKAYPGRPRSHVKLRQSVGELLKLSERRLDNALEEFIDDNAWFQPQFKLCYSRLSPAESPKRTRLNHMSGRCKKSKIFLA